MYVCVNCESGFCIWQVQVSVYCACRIPAHLRYTQCSTMLYIMDICFLTCICFIADIANPDSFFEVVGLGLVVVCHGQVRRQVSQGSRCRGS